MQRTRHNHKNEPNSADDGPEAVESDGEQHPNTNERTPVAALTFRTHTACFGLKLSQRSSPGWEPVYSSPSLPGACIADCLIALKAGRKP
jgi:hypothetical protein